MSIFVKDKEYRALAVYRENGNVRVYSKSLGVIGEFPLEVFLKEYKYANGREIKNGSVKHHSTLEVQKVSKYSSLAMWDGKSWGLKREDGTVGRVDAGLFPLIYEVYNARAIPSDFKETCSYRLGIVYVSKKGICKEIVEVLRSGDTLFYTLGTLNVASKKVNNNYKTDWNLAKAVKKGLEELVWDGSIQVVSFERF